MLRNLKVRSKLMAVVALPLMALVAFAVVGARDRLDEAKGERKIGQLLALAEADVELAHQLEIERLWTTLMLSSNGKLGTAQVDAARAKTNQAADRFLAAPSVPEVGTAFGQVATAISTVRLLRDEIDAGRAAGEVAANRYDEALEELRGFLRALAPIGNQVDFLQQIQVLSAIEAAKQSLASLNIVIARAFISDGITVAERTAAQFQNEQFSEREEFLDQVASDKIRTAWADLRSTPEVRLNTQLLRDFRQLAVIDIDPTQLSSSAVARHDAIKMTIEDELILDSRNLADEREAAARAEAQRFVLVASIVVLSALLLATLFARSIVHPLRRLTRSTYELSEERLPQLLEQLTKPGVDSGAFKLEPIEVRSRDEIGQLAVAFNALQDVTMSVAQQQSTLLRKGIGDIFVNLARRNQSLLDRQIEFIDQLEANEEDPDQLENLFKLDHLATRMRRNAESLLVLAGAEPPRRRGRPVDVSDVVRVAIGEVEQFARVTLLALDGASVAGNVAVDLAHLLSELMENATQFSPPETQVEIVGHLTRDGNYVISVSDQGIGMSAEQLADANRTMANPPMLGLALTRSLGFTVIGRLAQRFGIVVRLAASPAGGVSALVTVPASSVTAAPELDNELARSPAPAPLPSRVSPPVVDSAAAPGPPAIAAWSRDVPAAAEAVMAPLPEHEVKKASPVSMPELPAWPTPNSPPALPSPPNTAVPDAPPLPIRFGAADEPEAPDSLGLAAREGLNRRTPKTVGRAEESPRPAGLTTPVPSSRSPEQVRQMLSRYRLGLRSHNPDDGSASGDDPVGR